MNIKINTRVEKDLLGHKEIPAHCYYGVQTLRALENFNLSPNKLNQFPVFINALAKLHAQKPILNSINLKKINTMLFSMHVNKLLIISIMTNFQLI